MLSYGFFNRHNLYCTIQEFGSPNSPIRVLVAMMILKEAEGLSDEKLFENCRFNMLTRSAIGLLNADDTVPAESTYYLFRKNVQDYAESGNENLFVTAFAKVTEGQCSEFEVSGKRIRMDSKLLGSNIAWLSRYELVHETFRQFYKDIKKIDKLEIKTRDKLDDLLKLEGNKIVFTNTSDQVRIRLIELGELMHNMLALFTNSDSRMYEIMKRVFNEQFEIGDKDIILLRDKSTISARSIQSPHDTDCHFRNKDSNKIKGIYYKCDRKL